MNNKKDIDINIVIQNIMIEKGLTEEGAKHFLLDFAINTYPAVNSFFNTKLTK